jgi:hypothetical protein
MARTLTTNFADKNAQLSKEARYTVQISFDTAFSDLVYFKSHADADVPSGATVNDARVLDAPARSQSIDPINAKSEIGKISLKIQDTDAAFTTLVNTKLSGGDGLRHKRVRLYLGYKGLAWSDYLLFQTQIIESWSYKDGVYTINCMDVQRTSKKRIFEPKTTFLDAEVNTAESATFDEGTGTGVVTVADTSDFSTVYHGAGWEDAASSTVGYIKISYGTDDYEVIRYTGKTATTFTGCTGGRFGTRRGLHTTDTSADDKRTVVEEYIYLDLPVPEMILLLLIGTYGSYTLPSHWTMGIDSSYVNSASFTGIGSDLWDTSDETLGRRGRFKKLKPQAGKEFIEKQLYRMIGCTPIIYNDGTLGIKRLSPINPKSGYNRILNASNIVSYGELRHDASQVYNTFVVNWNYQLDKDDFTRQNIITDSVSIAAHQATDAIVMDMYGLDGTKHTSKAIKTMFDFLRQRYTGPPKLLELQVLFKESDLSVGDIVRVQLDQIRDSAEGTASIDQSFEVQKITVNPTSGLVSLSLFGGSVSPTSISHTSDGTALDSGMYSTTSLAPGNKLDTFCSSTYLDGTVLHVDSSNTFTGQTTLPGASNAGVYWYDDDVYFDSGYTQTITENVVIMAEGFITYECAFNGVGGSSGTGAGAVGTTRSGNGVALYKRRNGDIAGLAKSVQGTVNTGTHQEMPQFDIQYQGGTSFSDLMDAGFPTDLRGSEGADGAGISYTYNGDTATATGGTGGAGGAGLVFICQGIDAQGSGSINLSGAPGALGTIDSTVQASTSGAKVTCYGGTGGGGAPGGLLILLDGSAFNETDTLNSFTAYSGFSGSFKSTGAYSTAGFPVTDYSDAVWRVDYLQAPETVQADNPLTTSRGSVGLVETTNTPETPNENLATITVTITPPSDSNFSHHNIYWKDSGDPDTAYQYHSVASNTANIVAAMDGSTYDIKAVPVSTYGIESTDYVTDSITMSSAAGGVSMGTGNYIQAGQTAYDTGTGWFIGDVSGTPKLSIGNSAGNKVTWDGSTLAVTGTLTATVGTIGGWSIGSTALTSGSGGTTVGLDSGGSNPALYAGSATPGSAPFRVTNTGDLTATSATITGTVTSSNITATGGTVGGFTLSSTQLYNSTNIIIDSSSKYLAINNAAYASAGIQLQYNSGTPRMYVGDGSTKYFKFDGTDVEVGLGTLKETVYEMYTSGLIKTNSAPSSNGGVQIDNAGVKCYDSGGNLNVHIDASNGKMVLANGTNIALDSNTGAVSIGSSTYGSAGIQLQYNSGAPRFYVGDGSNKSIEFDGTDVVLGSESQVLGASAYSNSGTYVNGMPADFAFQETTSGAGSITYPAGRHAYLDTGGTTGSAYIQMSYTSGLSLTSASWSNDIKLKFVAEVNNYTNGDSFFGVGNYLGGNNCVGFLLDETDGHIYSYVEDGTTTTANDLGAFSSGPHLYEIVFTSATSAKFYIDGTLQDTVSSNLPTGSLAYVAQFYSVWTDTGSYYSLIGEFKLLIS